MTSDRMLENLVALRFISPGRAEIIKHVQDVRARGASAAEEPDDLGPAVTEWLEGIGDRLGELEKRHGKALVRAAVQAARATRGPASRRLPASEEEAEVWAFLADVEFSFGELVIAAEGQARDRLPAALERLREGKPNTNRRPPAPYSRVKAVIGPYLPTKRLASAADTAQAHQGWLALSDQCEAEGLNRTAAAKRVAAKVGRSFHHVNDVLKRLRQQRRDLEAVEWSEGA